MPFSPKDATRHTKKANTPRLKRLWARVANTARLRYGDKRGIVIADAAVIRAKKKRNGILL